MQTLFYGTFDELRAFMQLNPGLELLNPGLELLNPGLELRSCRCGPGDMHRAVLTKDDAPGNEPEGAGSGAHGVQPAQPDSTRQDRPAEQTATRSGWHLPENCNPLCDLWPYH